MSAAEDTERLRRLQGLRIQKRSSASTEEDSSSSCLVSLSGEALQEMEREIIGTMATSIQSRARYKVEQIRLIKNPDFVKKLQTVPLRMRRTGLTATCRNAFIHLGFQKEDLDEVLSAGVTVGRHYGSQLGKSDEGVYLHKNADLTLLHSFFGVRQRILYCKIIHGDPLHVPWNYDGHSDPIYRAHCVKPPTIPYNASYESQLLQYRTGQTFVYDFCDDDTSPMQHPDNVIPYAIIDLAIIDQQRIPGRRIQHRQRSMRELLRTDLQAKLPGRTFFFDSVRLFGFTHRGETLEPAFGLDTVDLAYPVDYTVVEKGLQSLLGGMPALHRNWDVPVPMKDLSGKDYLTGVYYATHYQWKMDIDPEKKHMVSPLVRQSIDEFALMCYMLRRDKTCLVSRTASVMVVAMPDSEWANQFGFCWEETPSLHVVALYNVPQHSRPVPAMDRMDVPMVLDSFVDSPAFKEEARKNGLEQKREQAYKAQMERARRHEPPEMDYDPTEPLDDDADFSPDEASHAPSPLPQTSAMNAVTPEESEQLWLIFTVPGMNPTDRSNDVDTIDGDRNLIIVDERVLTHHASKPFLQTLTALVADNRRKIYLLMHDSTLEKIKRVPEMKACIPLIKHKRQIITMKHHTCDESGHSSSVRANNRYRCLDAITSACNECSTVIYMTVDLPISSTSQFLHRRKVKMLGMAEAVEELTRVC